MFQVEPNDLIQRVKEKILKRDGIPVDQQRLMWAGKQLSNDKTVADYGLQDGNTVYLVLRLEGGSTSY